MTLASIDVFMAVPSVAVIIVILWGIIERQSFRASPKPFQVCTTNVNASLYAASIPPFHSP